MSFIKNILAALLRRLNLLGPEIVRYNDLKAYTMVNSITLSSDMSTLYLIDDGRAVPFKLREEKMILVGSLKGQITVATSLAPDEKAEAPAAGAEDPDASSSGILLRSTDEEGNLRVVKVAAGPEAQWTIAFNSKFQIMALIGVTEINPGLTPDRPEPLKPQIFTFDLNDLVVGFTRIGNALLLTPMRRGKGSEKPSESFPLRLDAV